MQTKISVTILAKNAQKTLRACLESVKEFDEVILLDNKSTDQTQEIAKEFKNVKIYESEFIGFGALKNLAISYATNDWIFSLDSDEVVERELLDELKALRLEKEKYYSFLRKNYYGDMWIKGCGWHPDWVKRLFCKQEIVFKNDLVHEGLEIPKICKEVRLKSGGIKHYSFENIDGLLDKLQRYSTLWAMQNIKKKSSPFGALLRGFWTFVRNFLFKRGFVYGYRGFVISVCNGLGAFFKYMKLYENALQKPSLSLIVTTYNQKERLALVLDSICLQQVLPFEVLIADDGSREDTRELVRQYQENFPIPLRHIWHQDCGYRLAKSRNEAIKSARGTYIVVIDGDMILHPSFVKDHQDRARRGCFVQGGRILLSQKETQIILEKQKCSLAFAKKTFKTTRSQILSSMCFWPCFKQKDLSIDRFLPVKGCNMAFFKEDVESINGFNEDFVGWGREDSEFVVRFLNVGGEMRKLRFAGIAYHLWHEENSRAMLEENHQIYLQSLREKKTWCCNGIKKIDKEIF